MPWTAKTITLEGDGEHTIRWTFIKDEVDEEWTGHDCAWLDKIVWTPATATTWDEITELAIMIRMLGECRVLVGRCISDGYRMNKILILAILSAI